jgi:hypothetical protein
MTRIPVIRQGWPPYQLEEFARAYKHTIVPHACRPEQPGTLPTRCKTQATDNGTGADPLASSKPTPDLAAAATRAAPITRARYPRP